MPRKPYKPEVPNWDFGPDTPAQWAGKVIEDAAIWDAEKGKWVNPNGVKRTRRQDLVEYYLDRRALSQRQHRAASAIRWAHEATQKGPPSIKKVQVDSSPKPDQHIAIIIDRISRFHDVAKFIPHGARKIVDCVVLRDTSVKHLGYKSPTSYAKAMDTLRNALDAVADGLKM